MRNDELNDRLNRLETSLESLSQHWASTQANTATLASVTANRLNRIEANVAHAKPIDPAVVVRDALTSALDVGVRLLVQAVTKIQEREEETLSVGKPRVAVTGEPLSPDAIREMVRNEIANPRHRK